MSRDTLILYPEYYSLSDKIQTIAAESIIIDPYSAIILENDIDYFFQPAPDFIPAKIRNKEDVNVRWVLENLNILLNREENFMEDIEDSEQPSLDSICVE